MAPNDSLFQDPPGHTRLRRLVSGAFTARRIADLRERITEIANDMVDAMFTREPPIDLMEALAFPLPITVIGELLGVPPTEREHFKTWSDALMALPTQDGTDAGTGWQNLHQQVSELIARKREQPGDDLLSALLAIRDADADRLSEAELVTMAITLIPAGYLTTATGIAVGTILLTESGQLDRLASDPSTVGTAVEEILRYQAAAGEVARAAFEDVELGGAQMTGGDKVLVSLTAANRDERHFAQPDVFDITRADNDHLTFGHGIHHCLGAALARVEMQVVFSTLASRLPNLRLATPASELSWQHTDLFGDEWLGSLPVTW